MKKLGIIIMIAVALTVGGVYATFNYAQKEVAPVTEGLQTSIAGKDTETAKGTITVDTSGYLIKVDDFSNNLKTGYQHQGQIKITFTPAKGADENVANNGVKLKLEITINGANQYNGNPIYKLTGAYTNVGHVKLNGGNEVNGTLDNVSLSDYIEVAQFDLPTADDYEAFKTAFQATTITITVSEA